MIKLIKGLFIFAYQQSLACIFPVVVFMAMAVSLKVQIPYLPRYDFILLVCIVAQYLMVKYGLETKDELKAITVFHLIGLCLEIYKVHMGSWVYPEDAYFKVLDVPLYSGFMYASVASYIMQAWRRHDLAVVHWPSSWVTIPLAVAIYGNFFTHHYIYDFRWILLMALFVVFFRTFVYFTVDNHRLKMPITLSFFLIGFFIWVAENISTLFDGYRYPNQSDQWELVHIGKLSSWFLLIVISIIIVAQLKIVKATKINKNDSTKNNHYPLT